MAIRENNMKTLDGWKQDAKRCADVLIINDMVLRGLNKAEKCKERQKKEGSQWFKPSLTAE